MQIGLGTKAVFFPKKSVCTKRRRPGSYEPTAFKHKYNYHGHVLESSFDVFLTPIDDPMIQKAAEKPAAIFGAAQQRYCPDTVHVM
ncbi:hypothetical protein V7124_23130 [Neobacillus niacini]|uniref:hypothetical protein n=1 Tax=Neobacillus niacini TaxID=86668 RepID=UPI002FFF592F